MMNAGRLFGVLVACLVLAAGCGGGGAKNAPTATAVKELDSAAILEQNKAAVVRILTTSPQGSGGGSGVVWKDATHVLTNAHVVIGSGSIKVIDPADGSRSFPAKVVALSACDDVALLSMDRAGGLQPAKFGDSDAVKPGDHVVALGFPGTVSSGPSNPILTEGTVSRVRATFDFGGQRDLLQHTSPINPGNSGGPLFNKFGQVIGLNSYTATGRQAENYAITINEATSVADKLTGGKNLDYLGINVEPNSKAFAQANGLAYSDGLAITAIDPGSAAEKAKPHALEWGDLIFAVNGTEVTTVGGFCDVIRSHKSGDTLRIQFGAYDNNNKPYDDFEYDVVMP